MYASGKESEFSSQIDALQAVLSSIPEELFHEIELEVHNAEGAATNKQRLEVLKEQQELIEEENEQVGETGSGAAVQGLRDLENIDEKDERKGGDGDGDGDGVGALAAAGKDLTATTIETGGEAKPTSKTDSPKQ
jgi:LETM1 and EF-hand domain-containing protein 1